MFNVQQHEITFCTTRIIYLLQNVTYSLLLQNFQSLFLLIYVIGGYYNKWLQKLQIVTCCCKMLLHKKMVYMHDNYITITILLNIIAVIVITPRHFISLDFG